MSMIPIYGFLEGDTLGLLILSSPSDSARELVCKMQISAEVRVLKLKANYDLYYKTEMVLPHITVEQLGLKPLDRVDIRIRRECPDEPGY